MQFMCEFVAFARERRKIGSEKGERYLHGGHMFTIESVSSASCNESSDFREMLAAYLSNFGLDFLPFYCPDDNNNMCFVTATCEKKLVGVLSYIVCDGGASGEESSDDEKDFFGAFADVQAVSVLPAWRGRNLSMVMLNFLTKSVGAGYVALDVEP